MSIPLNQIQLVNQCMNELGRTAVTQATDDPYALVISQRIDTDIRYLIQQHYWAFSLKYIEIDSPDTFNPSPDWGNAFTLPVDWLKMYNMRSEINYQIMGRQLLVNGSFVQFYYVALTEDYTILPPYFVQVLIYYTCSRVAPELTQNIDLANRLTQLYMNELATAKIQNDFLIPVGPAPYNPYDRGGSGGGASSGFGW